MNKRILIVGHADADGHVISEQVRRNLDLVKGFDVDVIVDPTLTKDHKAWLRLDELSNVRDVDMVFFVDMMFAPASFSIEASALVNFVTSWPHKQFFLLDHHPLPLRRLSEARNLRVMYRPRVFDCAVGPRSEMMIVAAICEHQRASVASLKKPVHETMALGMRRAAAPGGALPGKKLLTLLKHDRWDLILNLGKEDPSQHPLPRGRRPRNAPVSEAMETANAVALELLSDQQPSKRVSDDASLGRIAMPYDFGDIPMATRSEPPPHRRNEQPNVHDLEVIVTLLEVAALSLTDEPETTFSTVKLLDEARRIGGEEVQIEEADVKIVLDKASFLRPVRGGYRLR